MGSGFLNMLYEAAIKHTLLLGIISAIVPAVILLVVTEPVSKEIVSLVIFLLLFTAIMGYASAYYIFRETTILPKVIYGCKAEYEPRKVMCVLEPSKLFSIGMVVSFYYNDEEGYERFLGAGSVRNIQEDKRIQVVLSSPNLSYKKEIKKIGKNQLNKKIVVKPSAPISHFEGR